MPLPTLPGDQPHEGARNNEAQPNPIAVVTMSVLTSLRVRMSDSNSGAMRTSLPASAIEGEADSLSISHSVRRSECGQYP